MELELYEGKYKLQFNEASHRYKVNGEFKQGVTTVLGILSKDGLIQWAANMVCSFIRENCGKGASYQVTEEDLKNAKYAHTRKRDKAADTGSKVHKWIEEHLKGNDLPIDEDMRPSITAFEQWEEAYQPTYLFSEKVVYSEEYDYCGTFDVAFEMNGKRYLGDFKTSYPDKEYKKYYTGRVRARKEHLLQCAAYDQAYQEEFNKPFDAYMVVYITKEGELHAFETDEIERYRNAWINIYKTFKAIKEIDFTNQYKGGSYERESKQLLPTR